MRGEPAPIAAPPPDENAASETPSPRSRRSKRPPAQASADGGTVRFFLSKPENNGIPALDRELDSEPEAIVESLKTGRSYFVISEWKGLADLSKKDPLIRKEAVGNKRASSS